MPMFGRNDGDEVRGEIDRFAAMPLAVLAEHVTQYMVMVDLPAGARGPTSTEIAEAMVPKMGRQERLELRGFVEEALQQLEHASLVFLSRVRSQSNTVEYALTRAGRAAVDAGSIADHL